MSRLIRVIPCMDVKDGRVVKGVKFKHLRDAGDPAELARVYSEAGADEIALLDLSASTEGRSTTLDVVNAAARQASVPLTVGGGISSIDHAAALFDLGVAKVSLSTAAFENPELITKIATRFGSDRVILSLDAGRRHDQPGRFEVTVRGGTVPTGADALVWVREAVDRGAGEVLVNSIDQDGVKGGFDLDLTRAVAEVASRPVIASGGAGSVSHFVEGAEAGADAVLGASVFHFGTVQVQQVKDALVAAGFRVQERA